MRPGGVDNRPVTPEHRAERAGTAMRHWRKGLTLIAAAAVLLPLAVDLGYGMACALRH
jgi:hypothetical protein